MCFRCSRNGYDIKVCVRGRDGNGSQVPIVASYDLIVSVIDWKISWHTIGLYRGRRRFELRPAPPVICNLWSMDRSGISITRKYKFISWRKLPACLSVRPVKANFERGRRRRSEKFCGIFKERMWSVNKEKTFWGFPALFQLRPSHSLIFDTWRTAEYFMASFKVLKFQIGDFLFMGEATRKKRPQKKAKSFYEGKRWV